MNILQRSQSASENGFYYSAGIILIILNKIRHTVRGYRTPRSFPITEFRKAVEYDLSVVENWIRFGEQYTGAPFTLNGKTILELGPGADLGVGLFTLMKGAKKYNAMDVHDLIKSVPVEFYEELFKRIEQIKERDVTIDFLRAQLESARTGKGSRLDYLCQKNFDLSIFKGEEIDLVLSHAAFEHFDDVEKTINQLSPVVKKGALFIAEIDLKTHTRWIKDREPLNIYRYPRRLYDLLKFRGSPNRLRPFEYEEILKRNGWSDIRIAPLEIMEEQPLSRVKGYLDKKFHAEENQMQFLNLMLGAIKR